MRLIRTGVTRWVIVTRRHAIKFPSLYSWRHFLQGILANDQEVHWWRELKHEKLCPVLFTSLGRFVIVMPRVRVLTHEEFNSEEAKKFVVVDDNWTLPVEIKHDSFGVLNGKLVAIDYGSGVSNWSWMYNEKS